MYSHSGKLARILWKCGCIVTILSSKRNYTEISSPASVAEASTGHLKDAVDLISFTKHWDCILL